MKDIRKLTDADLAALLKERNHAAFTEIYNRYWQELYIYAHRRLKDEDEAADVVQDLFTTLWNRSSEDFHIDTSLKAYLYTAIRNQTLNNIQKTNRKEAYTEKLAQVFEESLNTTDNDINFRELSALLEREIAKLPPRMKAVYQKSRVEGLSHRAIAEEMGITEASSKTTLNRAVNYLKAKLAPFLSILLLFLHS